MPLQKPNAFAFTANNGCKFTVYGETSKQALMQHLLTCTKMLGRQINLKEARDPDIIIMIRPEDFMPYFDSFDAAASMAWEKVSAPKKERFVFKMNNGERFTEYGESQEEVLMNHLITKTKKVGHRLKFEEADNPDLVVMVRPRTYALVFSSFDEAAETAWRYVQSGQ